MKRHTIAIFTILLCSFGLAIHVRAQPKGPERIKWETKLETFQRKAGTLLVKGSSRIGVVECFVGKIHVSAIEYLDTSSGEKERGIELFITAKDGSYPQIDYDEIDSLVKAIERLTTLDKNVTGLEKYEAIYRTRGNMTVGLFGKGLHAVVDGNTIGGGIVELSMEKLGDLKRLITEAKVKLDSLTKATK